MVFGYSVVLIPILFIIIFLSSTTGFENLNILEREPYYILYPRSALIFFIWYVVDRLFYILSTVKMYLVFLCSFNQRDYT